MPRVLPLEKHKSYLIQAVWTDKRALPKDKHDLIQYSDFYRIAVCAQSEIYVVHKLPRLLLDPHCGHAVVYYSILPRLSLKVLSK